MRFGRFVSSGLAVAILVAGACSSATAPSGQVELLNVKYMYLCEHWSPRVPPVERTVFDLQSTDSSEAQMLARVTAAGGIVRYSFQHILMVRAELDVAAIAGLVQLPLGGFYVATTVSNPANLEVIISLFYDRPITQADISAAEAVGARYLTQSERFLRVIADDRLSNALRALPGVRSINGERWGCVNN